MSDYFLGLIQGFGYGLLIVVLLAMRSEQQAAQSLDELEKKYVLPPGYTDHADVIRESEGNHARKAALDRARERLKAKAAVLPPKPRCKYGDPACPCNDGDQCNYEGENPMVPPDGMVPICDDQLRVIYKETIYGNVVPECIRDRTGLLFSFRDVQRYEGQDERYERECKQMDALASYLLKAMLAVPGGGKEST